MKNSTSIQKLGIILLCTFVLLLKIEEVHSQCVRCLTNTLNIGTGFDQEINAYYNQGVQDQYWQISSGPGGLSYPMCAYSHGPINKLLWAPATTNSTAIGLSTLEAPGNTPCQGDNCNNNDPLYKFERHICVNTTRFETSTNPDGERWANLIFQYLGDINVINITLYDPNNNVVVQQTGCDNQSGGGYVFSWGGGMHTGIYTLSITVANDWECAGIIPQIVGQTPMRLEVSGAFLSAWDIFTDNNHFGKNTLCYPPYPPGPDFSLLGNNCIDTLQDTLAYDTISLYHPLNNSYVIFGTSTISPITTFINLNGDTLGVFTATIGTDTIISTDAKGCSDTVIFRVSQIPSLTVTPIFQCIPPGSTSAVQLIPSPGNWDDFMGYSLDNDLYVANLDSFIMLSQGIHPIVIMDSNRCISDTAIATIGNEFTVWMTASPPCLTPGGTSTLHSGIIEPVLGPWAFSYDGNPFSPSSTHTVSTAGTHTVVIMDMYGCTATQTAIVNPIPNPGMTLSAPPGCIWPFGSTTITATVSSGGPYLFQIKVPGSGWSAPQIGNTFAANVVGTYEVRVSDSNGCYSIPAKIDIGDCSHCLPNLPPNAQWYINSVSSSSFPSGTIPTTPIVIDSILYVDGNLNIWNNPNVFFTAHARIIMNNSSTNTLLNINNSTLQPCYFWWHGIFASNDKQSIKVENNSNLNHMVWGYSSDPSSSNPTTCGINVSNGAILSTTDSKYENNLISIVITNGGLYSGEIKRNTFIGNDPYLPNNWGFSAIEISNTEDATIGGNVIDVNDGNSFENLNNGILTGCGGIYSESPLTSHIRIHNNRFKNIKFGHGLSYGIYRDQAVLSGTYSVWTYATGVVSKWGSAICSYSGKGFKGNSSFWPDLTVEVRNFTTNYDDSYSFFPGIFDCDRGVVTGNTNLIADKLLIDNTMLGTMNQSVRSKYYQISDNFINNAHYGIQVAAPIGMSVITGNTVNTRNYAIPWLWPYTTPPLIYYKSPVGIDITHMYQNNLPGPVYNYLDNNTVNIPYITGAGISVTKGDQHQYIGKNTINFGTMSIAPDYWHIHKALYGLSLYSCQGSLIDQNSIFGLSNKTVFDARNAIGVYFENNKKCIVNCNRAKYTRYGFYAWGDNTTASTNITFNKFSGNKYPWYFLDAGATLPGTFGDVGNGSADNGNNFLGSVNRLNSSQFKVYRNSNVAILNKITTLPSLLNFSESGSSGFGAQYGIVNPILTPNTDPCLDPLFVVGPDDNDNSDEDMQELEDIIADSIQYMDHQDVAAWLGEKHAYEALAEDSTLRYSSIEMQNFYTAHQNSLIGRIYEAERAIKLLIDSTTDISNFESRFANAISLNDLISGGEEWEQNEHDLNSIYLKLISNSNIDTIGYDTIQVDSTLRYFFPIVQQISSSEKDYLRNLAYGCPYVAGSSVFRARTLWAMFDPSAFYDDRVLCLSSSGKNSNQIDVNIDSLYESQIENLSYTKPIINTHILKDGGEVLIYPNPANSSIIIEYTCQTNGNFELSNSMGQVVYSTELSGGKKKVLLQVNELTSGVYFYKCKFENCEDAYGKLLIEK